MGDPAVTSQTLVLSVEDQEHIEELKAAYRSSLDVKIDKEPRRDQAKDMADLANICEVSVRRVIDMAKKVRCFKSMGQHDQISLLKGGSIELLILRSVITFDKDKQQFLESGDSEETSGMTVEQLRKAENGTGLFDEHMKFVKALLVDMRADQETLILLLMISLFSPDRPNLVNRLEVTEQQEKYSILLKKYLESKYPVPIARSMYPKLLMKLTDIRNLNEGHSQVLLKVNPEGIQPLMQEVLDLGKDDEKLDGSPQPATPETPVAVAASVSPPAVLVPPPQGPGSYP